MTEDRRRRTKRRDECPDEMRLTFVKCARPTQLSESDPPALPVRLALHGRRAGVAKHCGQVAGRPRCIVEMQGFI